MIEYDYGDWIEEEEWLWLVARRRARAGQADRAARSAWPDVSDERDRLVEVLRTTRGDEEIPSDLRSAIEKFTSG